MKMKKIWPWLFMAMTAVVLPSCLNDDNDEVYMIPNAVVTLKTQPDTKEFYMQLDDSTTLKPTNMDRSPYGEKELRAFISYVPAKKEPRSVTMTSHQVEVHYMDSIRTKNMAENMGPLNNDYGVDPMELVNDWTTVVEDGYLTIRFRTYFRGYGQPHHLNLVATNPENPYEVTIYHDAKGDLYGDIRDGIIAFRLDKLPSTNGETVKLKVNWQSFIGKKSAEFNYRSRD